MTARLAAAAGILVLAIVIGFLLWRGTGDDTPDERADDAAVVWAVGDGADGGEDALSVAQLISSQPFDRFLYLGDIYDDGTEEEFEEHYDAAYGHFADRTAPTPGNHEWDSRNEGYDPYWDEMMGRPIEPWYAFDLGGWELISLNSEEPVEPGSPQQKWLEGELSEPGSCRIAYWHSPRFSASVEHHGDDPEMQPLWDSLKGRATIVLGAHDHDMQRFKPIDGITQFVSGAGGHNLYELDDDPRLAFGNDTDYGALRLELRPGVADYSFVTVDGEVVDRGTLRCKR